MSTKSIKQTNAAAGTTWAYVYNLQANTPVEIYINVVEVRPVGKALEAPTVRWLLLSLCLSLPPAFVFLVVA